MTELRELRKPATNEEKILLYKTIIADFALDLPFMVTDPNHDWSFVDSIVDGTLTVKDLLRPKASQEDWDIYISEALEDASVMEAAGLFLQEKKKEIEDKYRKNVNYYECFESNCALYAPRPKFLLEQPDQFDEDGNPVIKLQCPDCGSYRVGKSKLQ